MSEPSYNIAKAFSLVGMSFEEWRGMIATVPAVELYRLHGELKAMSRHPSLAFDAPRKFAIGEKLAEIMDESERRWMNVWEHPSNEELSSMLYRTWRVA